MPPPPDVSLWTRYVLENPWPAGGLLLGVAIALGWMGLRDERKDRVRAAMAAGLIGAVIITLGLMVRTSGERAAARTRSLIAAAVEADVPGVMSHFAPGAKMALGSPENPGYQIDFIRRQAEGLEREYRIASNTITNLDAYTISGREARVDLACLTDVGWGPIASQWVLRFAGGEDGEMAIVHLTLISIGRRSPGAGDLR